MGIFSDMHVGSAFAILPDNYKTKRGNLIHLNEGQERLLEHWHFCRRICNKHNVDTVVLDGDILQGLNYKNLGEGLILSELSEQKRAAIELLKPICKGRTVIGVSGTHYHDSRDTKMEEDLIKELDVTSLAETSVAYTCLGPSIEDPGRKRLWIIPKDKNAGSNPSLWLKNNQNIISNEFERKILHYTMVCPGDLPIKVEYHRCTG